MPNLVTRHGEAESLVRSAVIGARVRTEPLPRSFLLETPDKAAMEANRERHARMGRYVIDLEAHGRDTGVVFGIYELPCDATALAADAQRRVRDAIRKRDGRSISDESRFEWCEP